MVPMNTEEVSPTSPGANMTATAVAVDGVSRGRPWLNNISISSGQRDARCPEQAERCAVRLPLPAGRAERARRPSLNAR